jgi:ribose 5-phosphate isomerase A
LYSATYLSSLALSEIFVRLHGASVDPLKKAAAAAAVDLVSPNTILGLGSGSTLTFFIELLGERVRTEQLQVVGVPTSYQTRLLAHQYGIPIQDATDTAHIDLAIDGADEIDPAGQLIKGAGGAHVVEKLVAACADRFVVVADESKLVHVLGERFPVPLEVIAPAVPFVQRQLQKLGGTPILRDGVKKFGPVVSDLGNLIMDVHFGPIRDLERLNHDLNSIPGVVGHGLFLNMTNEIIIAKAPLDDPMIERRSFPKLPAR